MFNKQHKIKLVARNEGKLKSYASCVDVRAWSHNTETKDRYLKDWIKSNMPVCVVPINTALSALTMMSWRRRGKISPRCHPECKSKVVLDSIYKSCHAITECLKEKEEFTKYFEEEEFETCYWPCDRCLDALKSIKLFWKIILDKIFKIKYSSESNNNNVQMDGNCVKNVASAWQKDLIEQAIFVTNLSPFINDDEDSSECSNSLINKPKYGSNHTVLHKKPSKDVSTDTDFIILNAQVKRRSSAVSLCKKLSRCTSIKIKTNDVSCGPCAIINEEVNLYKNNLDYLQQQFNLKNDEIKQLQRENMSLKLELRNRQSNLITSFSPILLCDTNVVIPSPFETCCEENTDVKEIESEMVITLKNCKNEDFRHISMLQVLHKTNCSSKDTFNSNNCKKSDDPIEVLTKVKNTFGAIVKRELTIANKKKTNAKTRNNIHQGINKESCNRISSSNYLHGTPSDSIFMSGTEA